MPMIKLHSAIKSLLPDNHCRSEADPTEGYQPLEHLRRDVGLFDTQNDSIGQKNGFP
jgi:hypothetical protein